MSIRPSIVIALGIIAGLLGVVWGQDSGQQPANEPGAEPPRLGVAIPPEMGRDNVWPDSETERARAAWVRFVTTWPGESAALDGAVAADVAADVERAAQAGLRVALVLDWGPDTSLPQVGRGDSVDAFQRFAVAAVRRLGGSLDAVQIGLDVPEGDVAIGHYQFLLKNTSLAVGAEAERQGLSLRLAQATLSADRLDEQRELWDRGSAAYVGVLPVALDASDREGAATFLRELRAETLQHPPASAVWAIVEAERADAAAVGSLRALAEGAEVGMLAPQTGVGSDLLAWVGRTHALLDSGYAPAPLGNARIEAAEGEEPGEVVARFLRESDFATLLFYQLPGERGGTPQDRLIVGSSFIKNTRVRDLNRGDDLRVAAQKLPDGERGRRMRVQRGPLPLALQYEQALPPDLAGLPAEELETRSTRELTADEIIARHQQVARTQSDELERWIADARVDLHFRLAQAGGTIDLQIESTYYWERDKPLEWEQTKYYINGNAVRWKEFPELPTIEPERVVSLPLDLTLDRTYRYRSAGRDKVRGRDAYVLVFQPTDPDADQSLYRGRVWIDSESFELLRTSVVQTGLESCWFMKAAIPKSTCPFAGTPRWKHCREVTFLCRTRLQKR